MILTIFTSQRKTDRGFQALAELNDLGIAIGRYLFERHAKSLLPTFAEIAPVMLVKMRINISQQQTHESGVEDSIGPGIDETRDAPRFCPTEQGRPILIGVFQVIRNSPRIGHHFVAVQQDWDPTLAGHRESILVGKAPWDRLGGEPFVCEGQLDAPAIGAEPASRLGAGEIKQLHCHCAPHKVFAEGSV